MTKQTFNTTINASRRKLWQVLWDEATYRQWTAVFDEGSHAVTDWQEGSKVLFLGADGGGMVSRIAVNQPYETMSFQHLGVVKDGVEDTDSEETQQWAGATENYHLRAVDGQTELTVEMDISDEYRAMFENTWPKALEKIKALAEE